MNLTESKFSIDSFARESVEFFIQVLRTIFFGFKNYWKIVIVLFVLFGSVFYLKSRNTKSYYESKASFTFNYVHKKVYGDMFFYLQKLVENDHNETLSEVLQLSPEIVKSISKLEAKNIVNSPLHQDFTFERIPFYLYLNCERKEDIPTIQNALLQYVLSDSANNVVAQKEIDNYRATLDFVTNDLQLIDSLLKNSDLPDTNHTIELLYLAKERQKEKVSLQNRLSDFNTIAVLSDFRYLPVLASQQNLALSKKYGLYAIFMSLLTVVFLQWYNSPNDEV